MCFSAGGVTILRGATGGLTARTGAAGPGMAGDSNLSRTPLARGDLRGFGEVLIRLGECLAWLGGELLGDTLWFWLVISAL